METDSYQPSHEIFIKATLDNTGSEKSIKKLKIALVREIHCKTENAEFTDIERYCQHEIDGVQAH